MNNKTSLGIKANSENDFPVSPLCKRGVGRDLSPVTVSSFNPSCPPFAKGDEHFRKSPKSLLGQIIIAIASIACIAGGTVAQAGNLELHGGGATFPAPLYQRWNDARIQTANPDAKLPNQSIAIVARQDCSGTTYAFTNHLSAVSQEWRDRGPGVGKVVDWSGSAMVACGNEGVASRIKISEGAIGYLEYGFAKRLGLPMASLENKAGRFVEPNDHTGVEALARNAQQMPGNLRLLIPDPEGEDAYPILTLSWLLLYQRYPDPGKASALKQFVAFGLDEGQRYSRELGYMPLPDEIVSRSRQALDAIQ